MANYAVTDWASTQSTLAAVLAEVETKLETLDSTNNTIIMQGILRFGGDVCQAYLVYNV